MEQELQELLMAWTGGEVSEERRTALLARLSADDAFRKAFVEELRLLGQLRAVQTAEPRWLRLEDELGTAATDSKDEPAWTGDVMREISELPPPVQQTARGKWLALAAGVVLAGICWWALMPASGSPKPPGVALAIVTHLSPESVATSGGQPVREGEVVRVGDLKLLKGEATLSFFSGATLYVEGEARLSLLGADRVACESGRLRVRMPEGRSGFTVTGPGLAVVDLGTEFAMNVTSDGRAALKVFDGQVEASVLNREGFTLRSELLEQDEAAELQPAAGRIARLTESPEKFTEARQTAAPLLALDPQYAETVMAAKPWGYWRMEPWTGDMVPNEMSGRPALKMSASLQTSATAQGNHSLIFGTGFPEQCAVLDGEWQPPAQGGYAVEMWVRPEQIRLAALANVIQPEAGQMQDDHYFLLQLMERSERWLHPHGAVRFLHRFPPGQGGGTNVFSDQPYVPGRWIHLVAQHNGKAMELYVNGRLVNHTPVEYAPTPQACGFLLGRLYAPEFSTAPKARAFVGAMDEVALYDRPLSLAEIQRHAGLGQSLPSK